MADREGFEPSVRFHVHTLSKRARSTTPPPVHPSNRTGSAVRGRRPLYPCRVNEQGEFASYTRFFCNYIGDKRL